MGRAEGVEEGAPRAGAGILLESLESVIDASCPSQLPEVHGGAEIWQPAKVKLLHLAYLSVFSNI